MSGGSYDYFYFKLEEMATSIRPITPLRKAFCTQLLKAAKACHDIEWVDSGDKVSGDEDAAIRECLGEACDKLCLQEAIKDAEKALWELDKAINTAKKVKVK